MSRTLQDRHSAASSAQPCTRTTVHSKPAAGERHLPSPLCGPTIAACFPHRGLAPRAKRCCDTGTGAFPRLPVPRPTRLPAASAASAVAAGARRTRHAATPAPADGRRRCGARVAAGRGPHARGRGAHAVVPEPGRAGTDSGREGPGPVLLVETMYRAGAWAAALACVPVAGAARAALLRARPRLRCCQRSRPRPRAKTDAAAARRTNPRTRTRAAGKDAVGGHATENIDESKHTGEVVLM